MELLWAAGGFVWLPKIISGKLFGNWFYISINMGGVVEFSLNLSVIFLNVVLNSTVWVMTKQRDVLYDHSGGLYYSQQYAIKRVV